MGPRSPRRAPGGLRAARSRRTQAHRDRWRRLPPAAHRSWRQAPPKSRFRRIACRPPLHLHNLAMRARELRPRLRLRACLRRLCIALRRLSAADRTAGLRHRAAMRRRCRSRTGFPRPSPDPAFADNLRSPGRKQPRSAPLQFGPPWLASPNALERIEQIVDTAGDRCKLLGPGLLLCPRRRAVTLRPKLGDRHADLREQA